MLTYFNKGRIVRAHMIALIPPMTSSFGGTGPPVGQIPLSTYRGDVPISEYMIPERQQEARRSACRYRRVNDDGGVAQKHNVRIRVYLPKQVFLCGAELKHPLKGYLTSTYLVHKRSCKEAIPIV